MTTSPHSAAASPKPAKTLSIVAPPFNPGAQRPKPLERFFWWSWHPLYPYWSKSCWGGVTERQAMNALLRPEACKMDIYHNKLIREDMEGEAVRLVEVADRPCKRMEVWLKLQNSGSLPR